MTLSERESPAPRALPPGATDDDRQVVADLVRAALEGDDTAFAELFRRFRDKVYRICFRFTRDHDEAMDVLQTTFIKVHRSLSSYREESSFATWISRVATNACIDHVRARRREGQVELDESVDTEAAAGGEALSPVRALAPSGAALNRELGTAIQEALDKLSDTHRMVFTLHCVEGMSYQAVADTLQISIGTVMSRLFHARRYLRRSLAPYLGEARVRTLLRGQEGEIQQAMGRKVDKEPA
jgi:RNA polymerase sigma-70 factor (ECF subfamily)